MKNILQLTLIPPPQAPVLVLLILRSWLGLTLLLNHGLGKVVNFSSMMEKFPDIIGIGQTPALVLVVFAAVICTAMITVGVAFFIAHGASFGSRSS